MDLVACLVQKQSETIAFWNPEHEATLEREIGDKICIPNNYNKPGHGHPYDLRQPFSCKQTVNSIGGAERTTA